MAPLSLQEDFDNSGLQIGSLNKKIQKVFLAVDLSEKLLSEAIKLGVDLIITHHPLIFTPLKNIDFSKPLSKKIKLLIEHEITLFSWHTPIDKIENGISEKLLNLLDFKGEDFILKDEKNSSDRPCGYGRFLNLENPEEIEKIFQKVKETLNSWAFLVGDKKRKVKKIGVCGGSGGFLFEEILKKGVELFITADVKYHQAREFLENGVALILIDHEISERVFVDILKEKLNQKFPSLQIFFFYPESIFEFKKI